MITGEKVKNRLNVLLLFGDDMPRFEKELILGFHDTYFNGKTYDFYNESIEVTYEEPLVDGEHNTVVSREKYPKNKLIEYAIEVETYRALNYLVEDYYKIQDYSQHQWTFARIIKCYISDSAININDYPYKNVFIEYLTLIVKESIRLYEGIFWKQFNLAIVMKKLSDTNSNATGYKLKPRIYAAKVKLFTDRLINEGYIDPKDGDKLKQFLQGEFPKERIEWIPKLHLFVYFIKKLTEKKKDIPTNDKKVDPGIYLISVPKQKWKNLYSIFNHNHSILPEKVDENFNKLGRKLQKKIDSIFEILTPELF